MAHTRETTRWRTEVSKMPANHHYESISNSTHHYSIRNRLGEKDPAEPRSGQTGVPNAIPE